MQCYYRASGRVFAQYHSTENHTEKTTLQQPIVALDYASHLAVIEWWEGDTIMTGWEGVTGYGRYTRIKTNNLRSLAFYYRFKYISTQSSITLKCVYYANYMETLNMNGFIAQYIYIRL